MQLTPLYPQDRPIMQQLLNDQQIGQTYMLPDYAKPEDALPLIHKMEQLSVDPARYLRGIRLGDTLIGFINDPEIREASIEVGYVIDPAYHGKGYMTQALQLAIAELFALGYRRVIAGAFEHNTASLRVMEKCGMKRLEHTDYVEYHGVNHRCIYYAAENKIRCLILDHDDTVVQSEATVNYPFFVEFLKEYRPGMTITAREYIEECYEPGYIEMCRRRFAFTDPELETEYKAWKEHIKTHSPAPYPGIGKVLRNFKAQGGIIVVASQSAQENILRDYRLHFDFEPDAIYGWDLEAEHRKPNPYAIEQAEKLFGIPRWQMLLVDDMKPAVEMARRGRIPIAFAGWGRKDFPAICQEMQQLCNYSFFSPEDLAKFLLD